MASLEAAITRAADSRSTPDSLAGSLVGVGVAVGVLVGVAVAVGAGVGDGGGVGLDITVGVGVEVAGETGSESPAGWLQAVSSTAKRAKARVPILYFIALSIIDLTHADN